MSTSQVSNLASDRVPGRSGYQLTASDSELVLFRLTDRPIHDAFGLFQAQEEA